MEDGENNPKNPEESVKTKTEQEKLEEEEKDKHLSEIDDEEID